MAEDSLSTLEVCPPDPATPHKVFLEVSQKDGLYPMMPHSMYCLPLWPGITLVLLTKVCEYRQANNVCISDSIWSRVQSICAVICLFTVCAHRHIVVLWPVGGVFLTYLEIHLFNLCAMKCSQHLNIFLLSFFYIYLCHLCQFPHSGVAMSVYTFWEAFAKLEKRLNEGQGGSTRGQPMHEVRSKLDKFLKTLALNGIQVCFCVLGGCILLHLLSTRLPLPQTPKSKNWL